MRLSIDHETRYEYESAVAFSCNDVRLKPRAHPCQTLRSFTLDVDPAADCRVRTDYYGNYVHRCRVTTSHNRLKISTSSDVDTVDQSVGSAVEFQDLAFNDPELQEFLCPSERVPLDTSWLKVFDIEPPDSSVSVVNYLDHLLDQFRDKFTYDSGATTVETDLEEFAATQSGVCQDFAHSFAAICRELKIPSRYVSGYVFSGKGAEASHAWVDVYLPDMGWVGVDPTNNQFVDDQYVVLAIGRDYSDCPPVDGVRRGGGSDRMTVEVQVEQCSEDE